MSKQGVWVRRWRAGHTCVVERDARLMPACVCWLWQELGEEGALMMEVLLRQNLIVVGAEGYTDCLARSTLEILMGEDD